MNYPAYITIENCSDSNEAKNLCEISSLILEEFPNLELSIIEENEYYFVIQVVYEDFEEIQELVSVSSYILTSEKITKFSITINYED